MIVIRINHSFTKGIIIKGREDMTLISLMGLEEILINTIEDMNNKKNSIEDRRNSTIRDIRIKILQEEI